MRDDIRTTHAMRLGLREIKGLNEEDGTLLVARRGLAYDSVRDVWLRTGLIAARAGAAGRRGCFLLARPHAP